MKRWIWIIICLFCLTGCGKKEYIGSINVLNWSSYIPDEVIRDFEKDYHIKINYGTYSSNEELLAKVSSVREGTYDLVFPSDYMVEIMKSKNLLEEIDVNKLENYEKIDYKYLNLDYDLGNKYTVPFLGAVVVLVKDSERIPEEIYGYGDLLNEKYQDEIVFIDDTRIVIGTALMALGYQMNSTDYEELIEAKKWLLSLRPNMKAFDSDSPKSFLITKEASIGLMWSAEAMLAKSENPKIEIIIPKEGVVTSIDNFAIMKGSRNKDLVYLFIDYILSSEVMEKIVASYPYSSVNVEVNERMRHNVDFGYDYWKLHNVIHEGTRVQNIGDAIVTYDKIWADIK